MDAAPLPLVLWRVTRLSLDYLLDTIELSRAGGDVIDPLVLAAIVEANVAPINQNPALQLAYADAPPPDELRRPVSINAVAQSVGLPFETVRRRIQRMARTGACVITPRGVVTPQAALSTPQFEAMAFARYQRLKRFYFDLAAAGALSGIHAAGGTGPEAPPRPGAAGPPVRVANRLLSEYMMRFIDCVMRRIGDPLTGLVLLEMVRANTEHLTPAEQEASIPIPDAQRRPVRIAQLAERLNTPLETVRRRVSVLERGGLCQRMPEGFAVFAAGLARPGVLSLIGENAANVERLFTRLHRLGVLATWDREALAAPAAARIASRA